ncbi:MAG: carboxylase [Deltaproteobacteria bacterium]|nr:MAG: carboxylase [Deltaproteobacteria bacterium]
MPPHHQLKRTPLKYKADRPAAKHPLRLTDVSLRDGQQCLFSSRMRTADLIPLVEAMDTIGFWALEVWGGASFEVMHRQLGEDPWARLRELKKRARNTPLAMLLRGQNLVGNRQYADDVAVEFVKRAAGEGVDVFRTFDALNDFRNFETVAPAIQASGGHFQGCIGFALTEPRLGGPPYTLRYYTDKARELAGMGASSISLKDMAGLLSPYDAFEIIREIKQVVKLPVHLHTHFTSGMGPMTHLKAVEAGVDVIDTCLSPFACRTSHPAAEPLIMSLLGTSRDTGLDLHALSRINELLEKEILPKYHHDLNETGISILDTQVLLHQTSGSLLPNLIQQLREMNALDRLDAVYKELPRVRKDLGQVPMVTPMRQIVAVQTVNNVLFDDEQERYRMMTAQMKDLCYGLYGRTPVPVDPAVREKALKGYARGEAPMTGRPASALPPGLPAAATDIRELSTDPEDILTCALFPVTGKRFIKWKTGKEDPAPARKPRTLEAAKADFDLIARIKSGELFEAAAVQNSAEETGVRRIRVNIDGETFKVTISEGPAGPEIVRMESVDADAPLSEPVSTPRTTTVSEPSPLRPAPPPGLPASGADRVLSAPLPGVVVSYMKAVGDTVSKGESVVILEAMKMENLLRAPAGGTITAICAPAGETVAKGAVLCRIREAD